MSERRRQLFETCLSRLYDGYGREELPPGGDVLSTLIRDILSQATSRSNSAQAYRQLVDAFGGDWNRTRHAAEADVAALIEVGGLAKQKAPHLLALLRRVHDDVGQCSLEGLRDWEPQRARDYLASFKGVGPKTAAFTLMRAAGMDIFPMNGGILRVLRRLGLLTGRESGAAAHEAIEPLVPPGESHAAHVAFVRHARRTCRARQARCDVCPLADLCPTAMPDGSVRSTSDLTNE